MSPYLAALLGLIVGLAIGCAIGISVSVRSWNAMRRKGYEPASWK